MTQIPTDVRHQAVGADFVKASRIAPQCSMCRGRAAKPDQDLLQAVALIEANIQTRKEMSCYPCYIKNVECDEVQPCCYQCVFSKSTCYYANPRVPEDKQPVNLPVEVYMRLPDSVMPDDVPIEDPEPDSDEEPDDDDLDKGVDQTTTWKDQPDNCNASHEEPKNQPSKTVDRSTTAGMSTFQIGRNTAKSKVSLPSGRNQPVGMEACMTTFMIALPKADEMFTNEADQGTEETPTPMARPDDNNVVVEEPCDQPEGGRSRTPPHTIAVEVTEDTPEFEDPLSSGEDQQPETETWMTSFTDTFAGIEEECPSAPPREGEETLTSMFDRNFNNTFIGEPYQQSEDANSRTSPLPFDQIFASRPEFGRPPATGADQPITTDAWITSVMGTLPGIHDNFPERTRNEEEETHISMVNRNVTSTLAGAPYHQPDDTGSCSTPHKTAIHLDKDTLGFGDPQATKGNQAVDNMDAWIRAITSAIPVDFDEFILPGIYASPNLNSHSEANPEQHTFTNEYELYGENPNSVVITTSSTVPDANVMIQHQANSSETVDMLDNFPDLARGIWGLQTNQPTHNYWPTFDLLSSASNHSNPNRVEQASLDDAFFCYDQPIFAPNPQYAYASTQQGAHAESWVAEQNAELQLGEMDAELQRILGGY
ncbi:hypothetical protein C8R43DRAFT_1125606 [Mycena crocata]|nr:hypothetical protein C8R43DRAFT_1125606 [Mycena crocata]